jgi:hypothetical protein
MFRGWVKLGIAACFGMLLHSGVALGFEVGFNQAWFKNAYGTQYLDTAFDPIEVERIFKLARSAGAVKIRLWFFETTNFPMLNWEGNQITGIREDYVRNVVRMLTLARVHGLRIYMTLLDPQVYRPDHWREDHSRFRWILSPEGGTQFLGRALHPLLQAIEEAGLSGQISGIDLANEVDAAVNRFAFRGGWSDARRFLCEWRQFIRARPGFESMPVSFSLRLHPLLPLPSGLLDQGGTLACADFIDFHSYGDRGRVHRCGELLEFSRKGIKPVILGEFGQGYFTRRYSDELQVRNTRSYLTAAKECGMQEALAWRLSDIRSGDNPEARYSFEAFGTTRPAFDLIRAENIKNGRLPPAP